MDREQAARIGGMDRQTLRDWVLRYNAHGVDGLVDRWDGGRPPTFTTEEQAAIVEIVLAGPGTEESDKPYTHPLDRAKYPLRDFGSATIPTVVIAGGASLREVVGWEGHPPEVLQAMRDHIAELARQGVEAINE